ncbi:MAG: ATP-binding protein [Clostridium sp.]
MERKYTIKDLEDILDKMPYQIWLKDSEGKHIYINKLGAEKLSLSKEDIIGKTDYELRNHEMAEKCVATDKILTDKHMHIYNEENVNIDGKDIYFRVNKFKLVRDNEKDSIIGGIAEEISLEKNIQLELENNLFKYLDESKSKEDGREFLQSTLEKLKKTIRCKDIEIFLYNKNEKKFSLYSSLNKENSRFEENQEIYINEQIENKICSNEINKDRYSEICNALMNLQKNSTNDKLKIKHIKLVNELFGVVCLFYDQNTDTISIDEAFVDNVFTKIGIIFKQIENRAEVLSMKRRKEELENIISLGNIKTDFFANISHEFRTPINIILSIIQLLLSDNELNNFIGKYKKYLDALKTNSYRLLRLVDNCIESAKIDNNYYDLVLKNYNIVDVVESVTIFAAKYLQEEKRNIIFDTDEEELILACDFEKIERVILNLISNAIKFSKSHNTIYVSIITDFNDKKVFISITNYGEKINHDDKENIFGKCTQIDDLFVRRNEGFGLGLFLTRKYVEMHKGEIYVETLENGTKFTFYLPIETVEGEVIYNNNLDENHIIEKCNIEFAGMYM